MTRDATCTHESQHFDRSLCACGVMHTYCNDCGAVLDGCSLDDEAPAAATARERELLDLLGDLAMEGRIVGLGDPVAEVNDQTGVLGRVRSTLGSEFFAEHYGAVDG